MAIFRTVNRTFAELATTTSILITMAYWLLLGSDEKEEIKYGFMNIHEHVMNTCIACISKGDLLLFEKHKALLVLLSE